MLKFECKVEVRSPIVRELTISIPADVVAAEVDRELVLVQKKAKIKGFRPGHVPLSLVRQNFLADVKSDVFSRTVRESYLQAVEQEKLHTVGMPKFKTLSGGDLAGSATLSFSATVEIFPEVKVGDLTKIKLTRESDAMTEADLEDELSRLREREAELLPDPEKTGPAKKGDFAVISFSGKLDNREIPKVDDYEKRMQAENQLVEVGAGQVIEDFDKAIQGMNVGESKTFTAKFPKDYQQKALAGEKAEFTVKIEEFKKKILPALDDEFAKRLKSESLAQLKEVTRKRLQEQKTNNVKSNLRTQLFKALEEMHAFDVPSAFVQNQVEHILKGQLERASQMGFGKEALEHYVTSMSEERRAELRKQAEKDVRVSLVLEKVGEMHDVKVENADLDREYARQAETWNIPRDDIEAYYRSADDALSRLKTSLREDRILDVIYGKAQFA